MHQEDQETEGEARQKRSGRRIKKKNEEEITEVVKGTRQEVREEKEGDRRR
jgi:hypothetical protein